MKTHKSNPLFRGVALYMMSGSTTHTHNNNHDNDKNDTRKRVKRRL